MMRRPFLAVLPLVAAGALAGCMVGPDFVSPDGPKTATYVPDQKSDLVAAGIPGGEAQRIVQSMDIPGQWWGVFQSPQLNGLIEQSLRANPDIKAAIAGLRVAQQNARAQRATLFPTLQGTFSATQNQTPASSRSTACSSPACRLPMRSISGAAIAGRSNRSTRWPRRSASSSRAPISRSPPTSSQPPSSRRRCAGRWPRPSGSSQPSARRRQSGLGAIPGADVATQQAALAQAEATLPPLEKALAQQRNLLAVLTGRLPSEAGPEHFELGDLKLPHELPLTLPSQLVEQRPDIRAAEANLHAASAQVGVAVANQLPQVTLGFGLNSSALSLGTLFMPGLAGATTGASAIQTLIDGGALAAKKRSAVAALEQADAQYQSIVLQAFRNVADTLNALEYDAVALKSAVEAERAAATALNIARKRLELGDTTYVIVLIAELTYQQTLLTRVQAQAARLTNTAALFQALGGGWWNRDGTGPGNGRSRCKPPASPWSISSNTQR
jgi:outer membrane protein TolC